MLPDYPTLKLELADFLNRILRSRIASHQGFVGRLGKHRVFEGRRSHIRRATGDSETTDFEGVSVEREISLSKVPTITLIDIFREVDSVAAEMGTKMSKAFFRSLDKSLDAAGQVDDAKGEKLSPELLLKAMEGIEVDFDENGNYKLSLVIHPSMSEAAATAGRRLEEDPIFRERHRDLIERKREAWRVRETSRRLVG
jgi:hypothetical protein